MMWRHLWTGFAVIISLGSFGCRKAPETPERVANQFLRAVKREDCAAACTYFSHASQEKIRTEFAERTQRDSHYPAQSRPENYPCKATFANRFPDAISGSGRLQKIEGTNATVIAQRRQPAGFALPGFSPIGWKKMPLEVFLVQENGEWKIDLVRPTSDERAFLAARQKAIQSELDAINQYRSRTNALEAQGPIPNPPATKP